MFVFCWKDLPVTNVRFLFVLGVIFVRLACRAKVTGPRSGLARVRCRFTNAVSQVRRCMYVYISMALSMSLSMSSHCIRPAHCVVGRGIVGQLVRLFFTVSTATFPPLFQYFNVHPMEPRTDLGCG